MSSIATALPFALAIVVVAGCAASGGASPQPSAASSAAPSAAASAAASPSGGQVTTAEQAATLVLAQDPLFAQIGPKDPQLIGQSAWYEVTEVDGGWQVVVQIGWGDCPAGCIDKHTWTYAVSTDGRVGLIGEDGPPVPSEGAIDY